MKVSYTFGVGAVFFPLLEGGSLLGDALESHLEPAACGGLPRTNEAMWEPQLQGLGENPFASL